MNLWETLTRERGLNEAWLKKRTQNYWERFKGNTQSKTERWQWYLQETAVSQPDCSLFECEMAYAGHAGRLPELQADKAVTLVILVGESFEPLLQSVWAHDPARLVPVVNKQYPGDLSGSDQWNAICAPLEMLLKRPSRHIDWKLDKLPTVKFDAPKDKKDSFKPVEDKPTDVFRFLEAHLKDDLKDPDRRVIVDITGAKKTMVAGAFMLAAYSDTEICYVDSKEHHEGRPFGYACHFREVDNPLKDLALQSWHNIEKLYTKGDYAHALAILNTAYPQREEGEAKQEGFQEIEHFRTYLQICAHWDEGDIQGAAEAMEVAKLPEALQKFVPVAVTILKGLFPKANDSTLNLELFTQTDKIVIYAQDELERVKRLIQKGASRTAFSRAYALYESLLTFRIMMLFFQSRIMPEPTGENKLEQTIDYESAWIIKGQSFCMRMFSSEAFLILSKGKGTKKWYFNDQPFNLTWNPIAPLQLLPNSLEIPYKLRGKRNLITHTYFPTRMTYAEEALKFAKENFEEYRANWVNFPNKIDMKEPEQYSAHSWETIRDKFGLQFIPVEKA